VEPIVVWRFNSIVTNLWSKLCNQFKKSFSRAYWLLRRLVAFLRSQALARVQVRDLQVQELQAQARLGVPTVRARLAPAKWAPVAGLPILPLRAQPAAPALPARQFPELGPALVAQRTAPIRLGPSRPVVLRRLEQGPPANQEVEMRGAKNVMFAALLLSGFTAAAVAQTSGSSQAPAQSGTAGAQPSKPAGDSDGGVSGYSGSGASGTSVAPGTQARDSAVSNPGQATGFSGSNTPGTATTAPSEADKPVAPQVSGPNRS
jgi:hypothetical protein